jgi:hypothetical protein
VPAAIRPKGKARKIKESVMGSMPNESKKKKTGKQSKVKEILDFEQSSRVK